jgi:hypothetical protein
MKRYRAAGTVLVCLFVAGLPNPLAAQSPAGGAPAAAPGIDTAPLFRVFLKDGTSLVSYGEMARVDDRVVFSMPTSASDAAPQLQLINIPSERVDWERTLNYAESVRATRYLATRAESDYALLTNQIAQALNDVVQADDNPRRLAIVEKARKTLAEWPGAHYNYKRDEIQQMLGTLDEAIASLRATTGSSTFDLTFVAAGDPAPVHESIIPAPGPREVIEQTIRAAQLTTSPAERASLLTVASNALEAEAANLPPDWVNAARITVRAQIASELETDRKYQALATRILKLATSRAQIGDVRGVQRVISTIRPNDEALGSQRPDAVASLVAEVEAQLDAARRLRLERDRWALRAPELRAYRAAIASSLDRLQQMTPLLEDIKSLSGSGPDAIGTILDGSSRIQRTLARLEPPSELREIHNLFSSAVQLADNAARIRREAALTGSINRAWDASSAAAGALMLAGKARTDLFVALRPPQFSQ